MQNSFYLLAYDIANPKRLVKIARAMEAVGERVQDSVFEAWLSPEQVEQMIKKVKKIMNEKEDTLRIYVLCSPCREKVRCVGMGRVTEAPGVVIV